MKKWGSLAARGAGLRPATPASKPAPRFFDPVALADSRTAFLEVRRPACHSDHQLAAPERISHRVPLDGGYILPFEWSVKYAQAGGAARQELAGDHVVDAHALAGHIVQHAIQGHYELAEQEQEIGRAACRERGEI